MDDSLESGPLDKGSIENGRSLHDDLNNSENIVAKKNETNKEEQLELAKAGEMMLMKNRDVRLFEENALNGIVNALPYIDAFDKEYEEMAKHLIEQEMRLMKENNEVKNYLKNVDVPYTEAVNNPQSILYKEIKRCEENKKFEKLNFDHYNLEEVNALTNDMCIEEWKKKLKKYEIILENSHNALINIELMDKYKSISWEEHLKVFSAIDIDLQNKINSLKNDTEEVNKKRKLHQLSFVDTLTSLQRERNEYKRKSNLVLTEINRLLAENRLFEYKLNVV